MKLTVQTGSEYWAPAYENDLNNENCFIFWYSDNTFDK